MTQSRGKFLARLAGVAIFQFVFEAALAAKKPAWSGPYWKTLALTLGFTPFLSGFLGAILGLSLGATQAATLLPASFFSLLALPFFVLNTVASARSPWAGGMLHFTLTGVFLLGCLIGAQALCVFAGWNIREKIKGAT